MRPAEAVWCGAVVPAAPDIGFRCDPATIFGRLPARYDQSRLNGARYTGIMSVTPVVARRAYTDAVNGNDSQFFYVKHFVSTNGGQDQLPSFVRELVASKQLKWRVKALDADGKAIEETKFEQVR